MEKTIRFDALEVGQEFFVRDEAVTAEILQCTPAEVKLVNFVKKSNSSANRVGIPEILRMRGRMEVVVMLPDPTPEELAAKAAEEAEMRIKWSRRGLVNGIETCNGKLARFAERLAANPHDAFSWGQDAAEASGKLFAYTRVLTVFDDKGYEAALAYATREALDGARHPQHSTATLSNVVAEAVTAGYAEFALRSLY